MLNDVDPHAARFQKEIEVSGSPLDVDDQIHANFIPQNSVKLVFAKNPTGPGGSD
jgi:hypothetical protein